MNDIKVKGVPTYRILVEEIGKPVFSTTPEGFDALAYQILALALNNGTREAFPGKLKKLLEEVKDAPQETP